MRSGGLQADADRPIIRHPSRGNNIHRLNRIPSRAQHRKLDFLGLPAPLARLAHNLQAIPALARSIPVLASLVHRAIIVATWIGK